MKTLEQITRAYAVMDHIEANPDKHDQAAWINDDLNWLEFPVTADQVMDSCGTTGCFAGWTVLLAGGTAMAYTAILPDGRRGDIGELAAYLLGMEGGEYGQLFSCNLDLSDVRKAVFDIFGPRPDGVI